MEEEYLDLIDDNDNVIGRKLRSEIYAEGISMWRAINLFIMNSKGELWVPRRTAHKPIAPFGLDFSCAGHVSAGDSYEYTLEKEAQEELNLNIHDFDVRVLGKTSPKDGPGIKGFAMNYEISSDVAPDYNTDDFVGYEWMTPQTLIDRIAGGEKAKSNLPLIVSHFYLHTAEKGA